MSTASTAAASPLSAETFEYVCRLLVAQSGIALGEEKQYLVQLRLGPLAKAAGHATVNDYAAALKRTPHGPQHTALIEAMTTNETSFFRDVAPFDALKQTILPELIKARGDQAKLRIWCGASSTGQEPYSISMIIREHFPQILGRLEIVATDLATSILTIAKAGRYSQFEVNRGLPAALLLKYFKQEGGEWAISPEIKKMVDFRPLNLITPWPALGQFDIIFLRNVMIYFTVETKREILKKLRGLLRPDGHLFLGAAETTMGLDDTLQRKTVGRAVCYQLPSSAASTTPAPTLPSGLPARAA